MKNRKKSTPLGKAIHSIRDRLGESIREFAGRFGISHASISGYEMGKVIPSTPMLLLFFQYAQTPQEVQPIRAALGELTSADEDKVRYALQFFRLQRVFHILLRDHLTLGQMERVFIQAESESDDAEPSLLIETAATEFARSFMRAPDQEGE